MKNYISLIFLLIVSFNINAQVQQVPQGFNYQATVRNLSGDLVMNQNVYFKFNILQGSQTVIPSYVEEHFVPTDDLGQVSLVIGQGSSTTGDFSELNWSLGSYYLGIEIDTNTGTGYVAMGTTQFFSVPYALYAENSGSSSGFPAGGAEGEVLSIVNGVPTWTDISGFINSGSLAEIITVEASNIDFESMTAGGNIIDDGGFTIVSKGVVWSESPDPTPALETKTDEGGGASSFTSEITGLNEETEYFYRAYATTSLGFAYGITYTFVTNSSQLYDQDGDGYTPEQGDCNDFDVNEYPGQTWYIDADEDGYGGLSETSCVRLENGFLLSELLGTGTDDCDDFDVNEYPGQTWYIDADEDGYGGSSETSCIRPENRFLLSELSGTGTDDCDDTNAQINPGAEEIADGIDNNCDGIIEDCITNIAGMYTVTTTYLYHDFLPNYDTNTQDMEIVALGGGAYSIVDFTGGLYSTGPYADQYGTIATSAEITECDGLISWSGQSDPWGPIIPTAGEANSVDSNGVITISWFCEGYGENGVSVYTPL
jgi:hypothetical protein